MKRSKFLLFTGPLLILLATCTWSCDECMFVNCDAPPVDRINAFYFAFETDTMSGGFADSDILNGYLFAFHKNQPQVPVDSLQFDDILNNAGESFMLGSGREFPFSHVHTAVPAVTDYTYIIKLDTIEFIISDLLTVGEYPDDCCCCYENIRKEGKINGVSFERNGSSDPVILKK